jgi:plastocyanin
MISVGLPVTFGAKSFREEGLPRLLRFTPVALTQPVGGAILAGEVPVSQKERTMKRLESVQFPSILRWSCLLLAVLRVSQGVPAEAQSAQVAVGAQSTDEGKQALAFLPNEIWVHAGDSVTWNFSTDEAHTVTFLKPGQTRPPFQVGCPGTTPDGSSFDGTACVNGGRMTNGQSYSVTFPNKGNFKLVCLIHADMSGVVHVLDPSEPLPHDQDFYDLEAQHERAELLSDASQLEGRGTATARRTSDDEVTAGISEIVATTGGGAQASVVLRFLPGRMVVHVGDTVEWTNLGSTVGHTVTFGTEPGDPVNAPPSANVFLDSDGARHALIASPADNVHSGNLRPAPQERVGLAQALIGATRFRVTFTQPGVFPYVCAIHDDQGMKGEVVVLP